MYAGGEICIHFPDEERIEVYLSDFHRLERELIIVACINWARVQSGDQSSVDFRLESARRRIICSVSRILG